MIDIAFAILSNQAHAVHFSNPGSFDKIKTVARITEILENADYRKEYMRINKLQTNAELKDFIMQDTLKNLNKFLDKYGVERDILSPDTFIYNHKQNMTGAKLIGIYANNNSMQAKFQDTGLALSEEFQFRINGRPIAQLDQQKTQSIDGVTELISKNCAEWLAASVDNVKDPVLAKLLQNPNSANLAGYLLRAGLSINEVGLFFKQPIVELLIRMDEKGAIRKSNIELFLDKLKDKYESILDDESTFELDNDFLLDRLIEGPDKYDEYLTERDTDQKDKDFVKDLSPEDVQNISNLYNMLKLLYDKIIPASDTIAEMTRCCRADSPNGGLARTLPMAFNQKVRLMNFWSKRYKYNFPLSNVGAMPKYDLFEGNVNALSDIDDIRELLYQQGDGMMLQAFTSLGVVEPLNIMATYFKPFQQEVLDMVADVIRNHDNYRGTLDDGVVNDIFNDLTTYILSNTEMLGDDDEYTYDQKRDWYMYEFPKKFLEMLNTEGEEYEAIKNLDIIKKLRVYKGELQLKEAANLTQTTKQILKQSMDTLLYLDSPVAEQLATDLFCYAYYSKGFRFDAFDYAQFFSTNFIKTVAPEVVEALRKYDLTGNFTGETAKFDNLENFKEQLYQNKLKDVAHYFDLRYVKGLIEVEDSSVIKMPLNLVYNDHMDSEYIDGREVPIVFTKLNTNKGYYVYDDIDIEGKYVIYTKANRYRPEKITYATWTKYNANMDADDMAQNYVDNRTEINEKLEELRNLSSNKRRKSKKGSAVKTRKNRKKLTKPHNALSKADRDEVAGTSIVDVNLVEKKELGIDDNIVKTMSDPNVDVVNTSGYNAAESRRAIKAIMEADDEVGANAIQAVKNADDDIEVIQNSTIKAVNAANDGMDYKPSKNDKDSDEHYPSKGESLQACVKKIIN